MRKRLAVLHRIGMRVEEVADGRHHFIPDDRVKVAKLDRHIVPGEFAVELGQSQAVILAGLPRRHAAGCKLREKVRIQTTRGGVDGVGTVEQVHATAPVPAAVFGVQYLFVDEVELIHLALPVAVVERDRPVKRAAPVVAADPDVEPTVGADAPTLQKLGFKPAVRPFFDFLGGLLRRKSSHLIGVFLRHIGHHRGSATRFSLGE